MRSKHFAMPWSSIIFCCICELLASTHALGDTNKYKPKYDNLLSMGASNLDWPWVGGIVKEYGGGAGFCFGVLISKIHIFTPAHCMWESAANKPLAIRIMLSGQIFNVKTPAIESNSYLDYAIFELDTSTEMPKAAPVVLATAPPTISAKLVGSKAGVTSNCNFKNWEIDGELFSVVCKSVGHDYESDILYGDFLFENGNILTAFTSFLRKSNAACSNCVAPISDIVAHSKVLNKIATFVPDRTGTPGQVIVGTSPHKFSNSEPLPINPKVAPTPTPTMFDSGGRTVVSYVGLAPKGLEQSTHISVNGNTLVLGGIDSTTKTITFLGPSADKSLRDGLNVLKSTTGTWQFWWEDLKLTYFSAPYSSERSFAIIAAIDDYDRVGDPQHRGKTGYAKLTDMVSGAEKLRAELVKQGFTNIITLYNENATSERFDAAIRDFYLKAKHDDADRLFIYFGGHGDQINGPGTGFLVPYDYDPANPGTRYLLNKFVYEHFLNIAARVVVVALDACSSGFAIPQFEGDKDDRDSLKTFARLATVASESNKRARNLIVASTNAEPAINYEGGIFTQALIEALGGGGDLFHKGVFRFSDLALRVREVVSNSALALQQHQEPRSFVARGLMNPLIFIRSRTRWPTDCFD